MKKNNSFLNWVSFGTEFKFLFSLYFMVFMGLNTVTLYLQGVRELSIITIWQIAGYSLVLTVLHAITTSKLKPIISLAIHGVLTYATTIAFSLLCGWWELMTGSVFWQFTVMFIVIYAAIYFGFTLYYKNEEAHLNKKLEEYKQNTQN